ncbi:MAG: reverse transcriptase family protein, partial [Pseudomonadota bacterium]
LKSSKIIPVFKNDSRLECKNYRPISLLSFVDKIFEKLISVRLYEYLMNIDFFCRNQYGFRTHHSPEYALLSLLDRVYKNIDSKKNVLLISVDLRKAFEVIRHNILIKKLENVGIGGSELRWFSSFLENRKHRTFVNDILSEPLYMKTGIPQGSCLGPLLFLIYINDINQVFDENEINIFADDTVIIITGDNIDQMKHLANFKLAKCFI